MEMSNDMVRSRRTGRATAIINPDMISEKYSTLSTASNRHKEKENERKKWLRNSKFVKCLISWMPGSAAHMALKKRVAIAKRSSKFGLWWDVAQVVFSVLACALYVSETYITTHLASEIYYYSETIFTQFFCIDFLFNWFVASSTIKYFKSFMTLVDIVTIVPVYVTMVLGDKDIPNLSLLRFLRILRLIRILRTFKLLGGVSGIKRQLITLSLTLLSLTFMAGGVVQVMENDVKQLSYDCKYINEFTNYEPSCKIFEPVDDATCDCAKYSCQAGYSSSDHNGEPSYIRCNDLPYFNCFYFIVVTMATVGYGDIYPTSGPSKVVIILFIITSLIVIPMQVNKLTLLLSMSSAFRSTYTPQHHENHVIICGHVTDAAKLERLFKEFFHPGRHFASAPDFHLVVLSPLEPPEEVRTLLVSPLFDSRVTYIIGSALSTEDLQRTRADIASAMFFVCNVEVQTQEAFFDDAATVLRTLSVNNFNRDLTCLVQVLRSEDRDILKDSDVDVVLCLDEFKTAMQARNAICPGLSTFIENIFHTFTSPHNQIEDSSYWMNEYIHGARMEMYFIPLEKGFLEAMNFDWDLLCEAVYVEFGRILAGVASVEKHSMIFNPGEFELQSYFNAEEFYSVYNVAVIMAMSQDEANSIAAALADYQALDRIMVRMLAVEEDFAVRKLPPEKGNKLRTSASLLGRYSLGTARVAVETSFKDIISYSKMKKMFKKDAVSIVSDNTTRQYPADLGLPSRRVDDASRLTDHIIVFGCVENVHLFVHELRRNLIQGHSYRPVVIMSEVEPIRWDIIKSSYKDIYFIENSITSSAGFNASNVRDAFGIILLASRDSVTMVEEENLDAETLFAFLKLERYVPRYVFFTVELTCSNNMSVLNSTIMRRSRGVVVNSKKYASRQVHDAAFNATVDNSRNKSALQHSQVRGTFSSQRKVVSAKGGTSGKAPKGNPGARINPISVDSDKSKAHKKDNFQASRNFWDLHGTHHVLPVFAAGRSYVPSVFDTLLCQSFFSSLAPLMCERLVCGEGSQTIFQEPVPSPYIDHMFVDLFRAFRSRGILVLGLYRSSLMSTGSALPYVFTSPWADTTLRSGDMVYVYGHPVSIAEVILDISKAFVQNKKGNFGLACAMDGVTGAGRTRQRSVTRANIPVRRAAYMAKGTSGSFQTPHRERSMRDVRSFESKRSFEAGEEKAEVDVNSYHPRQRRRSGEGGSVRSYRSQENSVLINCNSNSDIEEFPEDLVKKTKPPSVLAVKSSDALEFDPDAKGFKAFQAVMKGYIARKEVKEKYNWERKIKRNEHGVQQFIDQKHEKGNTSKEHDMAIMIQKQVRGHSSRSKSLKQLLK